MFIYYHSRLSARFFFSSLKFECDASVPTSRSGCHCLSHDGAVYMCAAHACTHTKHHDIHCWKLLAQCNFALILCKGLKLYRKCLWCFFFGVRKRYCAVMRAHTYVATSCFLPPVAPVRVQKHGRCPVRYMYSERHTTLLRLQQKSHLHSGCERR